MTYKTLNINEEKVFREKSKKLIEVENKLNFELALRWYNHKASMLGKDIKSTAGLVNKTYESSVGKSIIRVMVKNNNVVKLRVVEKSTHRFVETHIQFPTTALFIASKIQSIEEGDYGRVK